MRALAQQTEVLPLDRVEPSVEADALISDCGRYRYTLTRTWDRSLPVLVWIMLNPSIADALVNDPTIRRCIGFARSWGYGGIVVLNLFAWRATDPAELRAAPDPVGPQNDRWIRNQTTDRDIVVAWGANPMPPARLGRDLEVIAQLRRRGEELHHLGLTKHGHPRHPLYVRGDAQMTRWAA